MNKVQDGYVALSDSYKPVTISTDRKHYASISFVGDKVVIRTGNESSFVIEHASDDSLIFKLVDSEGTSDPDIDEPAQQKEVVE